MLLYKIKHHFRQSNTIKIVQNSQKNRISSPSHIPAASPSTHKAISGIQPFSRFATSKGHLKPWKQVFKPSSLPHPSATQPAFKQKKMSFTRHLSHYQNSTWATRAIRQRQNKQHNSIQRTKNNSSYWAVIPNNPKCFKATWSSLAYFKKMRCFNETPSQLNTVLKITIFRKNHWFQRKLLARHLDIAQ